jgi:ATP-dependent protease ClpP protease subunit
MTVRKKLFYQISTSGRTADINIYGDITGNAELINAWMDTDTGAVSARSIVQQIQELDVDTINVYINSYGGEVAEALAIYSALKRHSASVHTFCDGFACSAATIIFCAGDVRTMGSIALLMIHNCMSYLGYANSNEMRKAAEDNDKINQSSINAYMAVVNISQDKVQEMMDNATWLTAQECLEYGFATEIADQETDPEHPEQSAFGVIREAVLTTQGRTAGPVVDLNEVMQKLAELGAKIDALQKPEVPDPEEDPEENVPENTARARAVRFFSFLTKED